MLSTGEIAVIDESRDYESDTDVTEPENEPEDHRSLRRAIIPVIVVVVIVLVFLLLRGCDSSQKNGTVTAGKKTIVSVDGLPAQAGTVSAWLAESSDIDTVLQSAAVTAGDVVNMGGGRYIVVVPEGTESAVVARLQKIDGVVDAGRVYRSGKAK